MPRAGTVPRKGSPVEQQLDPLPGKELSLASVALARSGRHRRARPAPAAHPTSSSASSIASRFARYSSEAVSTDEIENRHLRRGTDGMRRGAWWRAGKSRSPTSVGSSRERLNVMAERPLSAVVLAAGEGTRMHSSRPKPLAPHLRQTDDPARPRRPRRAARRQGRGRGGPSAGNGSRRPSLENAPRGDRRRVRRAGHPRRYR